MARVLPGHSCFSLGILFHLGDFGINVAVSDDFRVLAIGIDAAKQSTDSHSKDCPDRPEVFSGGSEEPDYGEQNRYPSPYPEVLLEICLLLESFLRD